jgi:hypothetical protein
MPRALYLGVLLSLLSTGCTSETSHGYQGELSVGVFAKDYSGNWQLDVTHDIFWDGDDSDAYTARCRLQSDGGIDVLVFEARDDAWEQGFEMTMAFDPFTGTGQYIIDSEQESLGFDLSLSTDEQTFDLDTGDEGTCNVTISNDEHNGDFQCSGLLEYVVATSASQEFIVEGSWECAEITTDG